MATSRRVLRRLGMPLGVVVALVMMVGVAPTLAEAQDDETVRLEVPANSVTVVMTEMPPFVIEDDGGADGFYAEIWDEVATDLGIDYEVLWVDSFAELLPAVSDGRADVAVAPLAPTAEREVSYDFTSAVVTSGPQLGYTDRLDPRPSILRSLFDWRVIRLVALSLAGLLLLAHVIWLFERNRANDDGDFSDSYLHGVWDGLWWATVTTTTVGYGDKAPKSFGGRAIALVAMLSSLVVVAALVSQVTSIMTEDVDGPAIATLADVTRPIGVVEGTSFASYAEAQGNRVVVFETQEQVFQAARSGALDVVIANPFALASLDKSFGITPVGDVLYEEFETFGLAQGSPWREPINQALSELQASGEIAEIIKDGLN